MSREGLYLLRASLSFSGPIRACCSRLRRRPPRSVTAGHFDPSSSPSVVRSQIMNKRVTGLSFALSITLFACVGAVSENDRPCPCASGWTCCSGNVCVGPGASCSASEVGSDAMASATEGGLGATGLDATLSDADGNSTPLLDVANTGDNLGGSCPTIAGFNSFASVSDAASVLAGRWVECSGNVETYGAPQTNLVSFGAPADAVG